MVQQFLPIDTKHKLTIFKRYIVMILLNSKKIKMHQNIFKTKQCHRYLSAQLSYAIKLYKH